MTRRWLRLRSTLIGLAMGLLIWQAQPALTYANGVLDLGSVGPGATLVYEKAVQLYVRATGPYRVEALAPAHFADVDDPSLKLPAELLEWRLSESHSVWTPMEAGRPTTIHSADHGANHVLAIDYRLTPSWSEPASKGGYALTIPYRVVGEAILHASTVWPNPAAMGQDVTVACVRDQAVAETLHFVVLDESDRVVARSDRQETADRAEVAFTWRVSVPQGAWVFRLEGSSSGLCALGHLQVTEDALVTLRNAQPTQAATADVPTVQLTATVGPAVSVGQWTVLHLHVQNQGPGAIRDARVHVKLPAGLQPVLGLDDGLYIPHLPAGGEWTHIMHLAVGPAARTELIHMRLIAEVSETGQPVEAGTVALFTPAIDAWIQPLVPMRGNLGRAVAHLGIDGVPIEVSSDGSYHALVPQGWHALWPTDVRGRPLPPRLINIHGGAPLQRDMEDALSTHPWSSDFKGVLDITLDSSGYRPALEATTRIRTFSMLPTSVLGRLRSRDGQVRWQLNTSALPGLSISDTLTGTLLGDGGTLTGLRLGWQIAQGPTRGGIHVAYDDAQAGPLSVQWSWLAENQAGGVGVRHNLKSGQSGIHVALWRHAAPGAPAFHIEHETGTPGVVRLGTEYDVDSPWGRLGVNLQWALEPPQGPSSTRVQLAWQGRGARRLPSQATLSWEPGEAHAQLALTATSTGREHTLQLGLGPKWSHLHLDWTSTQRGMEASSQVQLNVSPRSSYGRLAITNAPLGSWHLDAAMELGFRPQDLHVEVVTRLSKSSYALQWTGKLERTGETIQVDHRGDGRANLTLGSKRVAVGLLGGVRTVRGQLKETSRGTVTAFAGGWGEVEAVPKIWAGVGLARWNSEEWMEYDVYLRYELADAVWLQAGYHDTPGTAALFPDHGRGVYARFKWAFHTGW